MKAFNKCINIIIKYDNYVDEGKSIINPQHNNSYKILLQSYFYIDEVFGGHVCTRLFTHSLQRVAQH